VAKAHLLSAFAMTGSASGLAGDPSGRAGFRSYTHLPMVRHPPPARSRRRARRVADGRRLAAGAPASAATNDESALSARIPKARNAGPRPAAPRAWSGRGDLAKMSQGQARRGAGNAVTRSVSGLRRGSDRGRRFVALTIAVGPSSTTSLRPLSSNALSTTGGVCPGANPACGRSG